MSTGAPPEEASDLEVTLTPMRRRHLPEVVRIEAEVYPAPWSERLFLGEITYESRAYVVARVGAQVVGYAGLLVIADDGHVTTVVVDPAWRRRGIAVRLLHELCRQAVRRGCEQLTLEVRASNTGAQDLYRRFGFAPVGVRPAYYSDREDALVMWAHGVAGAEHAARRDELLAAVPGRTRREGLDGPSTAESADATGPPAPDAAPAPGSHPAGGGAHPAGGKMVGP